MLASPITVDVGGGFSGSPTEIQVTKINYTLRELGVVLNHPPTGAFSDNDLALMREARNCHPTNNSAMA